MSNNKIKLSEAVRFHGHLGPYLILGILAGELAIENLGCRKYFDLYVKVWGADKKPKSCIIDGLQLSTGATYGKGNIEKLNGRAIKMEFSSRISQKKIILRLKSDLIRRLKEAKTHRDAEILAKELYNTNWNKLFKLSTVNCQLSTKQWHFQD
jgi:formylmethanofuran dehydrogenase subunit E